MNRGNRRWVLFSIISTLIASAALAAPKHKVLTRSQHKHGESTQHCDQTLKKAEPSLQAIVAIDSTHRNTRNTLLAFETTMADFEDAMGHLTFMKYVSVDQALR